MPTPSAAVAGPATAAARAAEGARFGLVSRIAAKLGVMQLNPRYGPGPIITLDDDGDIVAATIRQRERLIAVLADFGDEQWAHPSRCEGWSNRDVICHLETTNGFWTISVAAGLAGEPTEILRNFDPVATPAQMV